MEGLVNPFEYIAQGIVNLGEHFSGVLSYLNPFSEDFLLKDLLNWLNPFSEDFLLKNLLDWLNPMSENFILKQLWDFLINIVSYLNPFSENFLGYKLVEFIGDLLESLFIPQQDHFGELNTKINEKFGFIEQVKDLVYSLFPENTTLSNAPPNWTITYEGVTVNIIDWSAFEKYRGYLHGLIIFIMWGAYLIRLYKRIPSIIYGFTDK